MSDQKVKGRRHLHGARGFLVIIAFIFVIQSVIVLSVRNDLAAFGVLLLLAVVPLGACLFIKGKR